MVMARVYPSLLVAPLRHQRIYLAHLWLKVQYFGPQELALIPLWLRFILLTICPVFINTPSASPNFIFHNPSSNRILPHCPRYLIRVYHPTITVLIHRCLLYDLILNALLLVEGLTIHELILVRSDVLNQVFLSAYAIRGRGS